MKFAVIVARFYDDIAEMLIEGATNELKDKGIEYDIINVPGVFEIPSALNFATQSARDYEGYIVLGCVIRGETTHYDIVANESARMISQMAVDLSIPLGFGVLTVESHEQAKVRAHKDGKNKGASAAKACIHMSNLYHEMCIDHDYTDFLDEDM